MNDKTTQLKEAIDLLYWTMVDAMEMNPESTREIEEAWSLVMEEIKDV